MVSETHRTSAAVRAGSSPAVAWLLVVLALAFLGRVVAQLAQAVAEVAALPPFDDWQSGALPYPVLLATQIAILIGQSAIISGVASGRFRPSPVVRRSLAVFGLLYLGVMIVRLVLGSTALAGDSWFDAILPSIFHLVLASFVLVTAYGTRRARTVG